MKNVRAIKQLPNAITMTNMLLGLTVLFISLAHEGGRHRLLSCVLIFIAAFLDGIDGKLARLLNAESVLGKQLDSFADFVSFGLAPAAVFLSHPIIRDKEWAFAIYICLLFYTAAGAFRLARFNIGDFQDCFLGLPITAAGFLMTLLNLVLHYTAAGKHDGVVMGLTVFIFALAVLMVSNIKIQRLDVKKPQRATLHR